MTTQISKRHVMANPDYVAQRVRRVFGDSAVLPLGGIQYALCEVGPRRFDPVVLADRIQRLVESAALERVADGAYALSDAAPNDVQRSLKALPHVNALLEHACGSSLEILRRVTETVANAGRVPNPFPSDLDDPRVMRTEGSAGSQVIWLSHQIRWIDPTDCRFWAFLSFAERERAQPIIIARKAATTAFSLCKQLGAKTLQYHHLITDAALSLSESSLLREFRLPRLITPIELQGHALWQFMDIRPASPHPNALDALHRAVDSGFHEHPPSGPDLIAWAEASGLQLPELWSYTVRRWNELAPDSDEGRSVQQKRRVKTPPRESNTFGRS